MLRCPNSGYKEILELGNPFQRFKIVSSIVARAIPITFFGIYVKYIIHKLTISINYNNNHKGPPPVLWNLVWTNQFYLAVKKSANYIIFCSVFIELM